MCIFENHVSYVKQTYGSSPISYSTGQFCSNLPVFDSFACIFDTDVFGPNTDISEGNICKHFPEHGTLVYKFLRYSIILSVCCCHWKISPKPQHEFIKHQDSYVLKKNSVLQAYTGNPVQHGILRTLTTVLCGIACTCDLCNTPTYHVVFKRDL